MLLLYSDLMKVPPKTSKPHEPCFPKAAENKLHPMHYSSAYI